MSGAKQTYTCANRSCRAPFTARTADRARGWARFCSKSCKAADQTRRTGYAGPGTGGGDGYHGPETFDDFREGWDEHKGI